LRYYKIEFQNADGSSFTPKSLTALGAGISSLDKSGGTNTDALNVELEISQYAGHNAGDTSSFVRIWGLPLSDLGKAPDYNRKNVIVSGGMSKGLPLANPAQRGPLIKGQVYQAFGNWRGTVMSLDMFIAPGFVKSDAKISPQGRPDQPVNWTFTWKKDQKLSDMLSDTLGKTMPGITPKIQVDDSRTAPMDMSGQYQTLPQFSSWLRYHTKGKFGDRDDGVSLASDGDIVVAFETDPSKAKPAATRQIFASDIIGQPMYYQPFFITLKTVMRGDLDIGNAIKLPKDFVSEVAQSPAFPYGTGVQRSQDSINFGGGTYLIQQIQHFGHFRQADATAWVTQIWASLLSTTTQ
jgi:hypothetical protein